jgi:hypothetical protein
LSLVGIFIVSTLMPSDWEWGEGVVLAISDAHGIHRRDLVSLVFLLTGIGAFVLAWRQG